ncbi:ABC transporter permease [Desertibaculum subflavum]|uniref:ABC transporter permease n=1 Tax=Desertibaculum subflavum TaxID=2268458 RepID=UPI000E66EEEC
MNLFLLKRFATFIATLIGTSLVVFLVLEVLPGDPALVMLGPDANEDAVAALRDKLGLNQPAVTRYLEWIGGLVTGSFGQSYSYGVSTGELIVERLWVTVPLALMAMLMTVVIALPLGIHAASKHNKAGDVVVMGVSQLGIAIPNFWFGILLILFFAVQLGWASAGGFPGWDEGVLDGISALFLPAIALALVQAAILARFTRSAVLDVLREDFVRTARAKGLTRRAALWGHAVRNALIPVVTIMGLQFSNLLAGTVVIENVFQLPGLGRLVFQAIANRDVPVVRDAVVILAAKVVIINFVVDLLYAWIDPRLKAHDV